MARCTGGTCRPVALENASPSTRLLEKWHQIFEVQEALEAQKQEFARKVSVSAPRRAPDGQLLRQRPDACAEPRA